MTHPLKIAPSILAADFGRLADEVAAVEAGGADWIHIDVMDGHFVPNITVGPPIVEAIRRVTKLPLDVHLMITNPDDYLSKFRDAGADILTVHRETCPHLHRTVQAIKDLGAKAGVSLNPATDLGSLEDILSDLDLLLIMSVNPGFGGQSFIPSVMTKIRKARDLIDEKSLHTELEVDGGVAPDNATAVVHAGATILVAGSAIFKAPKYATVIHQMRQAGIGAMPVETQRV
ncbi:MAG TPA: ribulose-phosphate 3-epimerase [Nitrospirales bacterium]|nr:ribulose-phosphate 3-epimerase [Nitrospirales bacterium]HIC04528.1 ribulose-phosphate 3-epimerase [Nitrospirales bacterium]HIN32487.1 ribulose-phosphate 3-epimerase [Nitrospirales bacterium]HIO69922.1 ribulose-phosphate 3-epimerase [Nitrospirales bacterium]